MNRLRRTAVALLAAATALGALTGCGEREDKLDEVKAALAATRRAATQFVYTDVREEAAITVAGIIEDDFRFKALASYDAQPSYEQVVLDDVLAMRFHDPTAIGGLVDPSRVDIADTSTELDGITSVQALQSKRWVVDEGGAPPVTAFAASADDLGTDPVFDAVTSLRYVEKALGEAFSVDEWRADALNPTYPRSEDVFPKPQDGSGVIRYDLRRLFLPAAGDAGGSSGQRSVAATRNFRKMAIYVKDGRVIRVLERVELTGKMIESAEEYTRTLLKEVRAPAEMVERFDAITASPPEVEGPLLLEFLNELLERLGVPPILARAMSLDFEQGASDISVGIPADDVVKGSLEVMLASGQAKAASEVGGVAAEPTTTTTAPTGTTSSLPIIPA